MAHASTRDIRPDSVMEDHIRLRILILASALPYPPEWGAGIVNLAILRQLAQRHTVSLLAYASPREADSVRALEALGASVHTVAPPPARLRKRRAQLGSIFSRVSYQHRSCYSREMQAAINRILGADRFDLVLVEASQMGVFDFPAGPALVLHEHNIEYELLYRTCRVERSMRRKVFNWLEYMKFRPEEVRLWKRFDGLVLMSNRERRIVNSQVPSKPSIFMPCGVDLDDFRPLPRAPRPGTIVFTGAMDYRPNSDAVAYFIGRILPRILSESPDAQFVIVGRNANEAMRRLAGPNVILTGRVPDVRPYLAEASVVVVPLRIGAGARIKVTEALAMGKAIVSTTLGCEGHPVRDGEHLIIADDPASFADAVIRLLRDPSLGQALGERARAFAEERYGWSTVLDQLEAFLIQMAYASAWRRRSDIATAV